MGGVGLRLRRARHAGCGRKSQEADAGAGGGDMVTEGRLWSLSRGALRRLRHKDEEDGVVPVRVEVEGLDGAKIVSVACGAQHSAALTEDGALCTWGRGAIMDEPTQEPAGLGHDDLEDKLVPTLVVPLHQLVARVGRCLPLPPLHALAFAMGTHRRLGAGAAGPGAGGCRGGSKGRSRMRGGVACTWIWRRIWCCGWWRGAGGGQRGARGRWRRW